MFRIVRLVLHEIVNSRPRGVLSLVVVAVDELRSRGICVDFAGDSPRGELSSLELLLTGDLLHSLGAAADARLGVM